MIRIPNYFRDLARDAELVGRDPQVWVIVVELLDVVEFKELRLETIAAEFTNGVSRASVHRSLHRLVDRGYLERDDAQGSHGQSRYRIPLKRIFPRPAPP